MTYFFVLFGFGAFLSFFGVDYFSTEDIEHAYFVAMQNLSFICFVGATYFVLCDFHLDAAFDSENTIFQTYLEESQEAADK